jgi:pyruvate,water dikinase
MTKDTYFLRRLYLALGSRMAGSGVLSDSADIFHMTQDEIRDVMARGGDTDALRQTIEARREELERDREVALPETILGENIPTHGPAEEGVSLITGIGASSGTVEGRARLVRKLEDAPAVLSREDILVVPFSDVGWTPLFATVGGIVAECGGQLSHTAIVAREYGLPAVVAARGAMQEIRDGEPIRVDGTSGSVHRLGPDGGGVPKQQP